MGIRIDAKPTWSAGLFEVCASAFPARIAALRWLRFGPCALLSIACIACAPSGPASIAGLPELVQGALESARIEAVAVRNASEGDTAYRELVHTDDLSQGVEFAHGSNDLRLVTHERSAVDSSRFEQSTRDFEVGFAIDAVAARAPWDLFVAGTNRDGTCVIERWRVEPRFTASEARPPLCVRTVFWRGNELSGVRLLAADPEARFVFALAKDGTQLLQIPLANGIGAVVRFDALELPALRTACAVFSGKRIDGGRVFAFESPADRGVDRALLVDRNDDGWFETASPCDDTHWASDGFAGTPWIEERFVTTR